MSHPLESVIKELWRNRAQRDDANPEQSSAVAEAIGLLDQGELRVAELIDDEVTMRSWSTNG